MYRRATPQEETNKKSGRSFDGPGTSDSTAVAAAAACKGVVGEGGGRGEEQQGISTHVTVVSYNVLADSLVSFDYIPYCKTWNEAAWRARPGRVLQKVRKSSKRTTVVVRRR